MIRILFLFIQLSLIVCSSAFADTDRLYVVADDDFHPFSFLKDGKAQGIDMDILTEAGRRLNIDIKIDLVPWKRLIKMTTDGTCDGSMSLFKSREREEFALFTYPVHYSTYVIFINKEKPVAFSSIEDLYGKRICKEAGFIISEAFDLAERQNKINVVEVYNPDEAIVQLYHQRADAFVANKLLILYKLNNENHLYQYRDKIEVLPVPVRKDGGAFFVLSKASGIEDKVALQKKITGTLKDLEAEGFYQKIVNKYTKY